VIPVSEKVPHIVQVCYGGDCVKRRIKAFPKAEFELVGIVGVAVKVEGKIRAVLPLRDIDLNDFEEIAEKYGINVDDISGFVSEIKEERKGERVLKLGKK
jgi:hypothetical protein